MKKNIWKLGIVQGCLIFLLAYFALVIIFHYAAGQQLYERKSGKEIDHVAGKRTTPEVTGELSIRQTFLCEMDKLDRFSVNVATFDRENIGNIQLVLLDDTKGKQLYSNRFRMEELIDGQFLECVLSDSVAYVRGHMLSIVILSSDAEQGNAAGIWYAAAEAAEHQQLYFNDAAVDGTICFSVRGRDYVWLGPHYWKIMLVIGAALSLGCVMLIYKKRAGKDSMIFTAAALGRQYRFLVKQLVSRDFKIKYRRSALGALWSFINPLMTMCVQYIVFSTLFQMDVHNYPVYLLSGIVLFNFFTETTNVTLHAISGNAGLITKVYVPKVIYPMSKVLSTGVNLLISLLPLFIMSLATGIEVTRAWLLLPYDLLCLLVFCTGMGFILSAVMVFFRDMQFIWSVLCMVFTYVTPVFYPESILSEPMRAALQWNPMYQYILFFRTVILEGISPEPWQYLKCLLFSLTFLMAGYAIFKGMQDKFIFYI